MTIRALSLQKQNTSEMKKQLLIMLLALAGIAAQAQTKVNIRGNAPKGIKSVFIIKNMDGSGGSDSVKVKRGKWKYEKTLPADVHTLYIAPFESLKQDNKKGVVTIMADSIPTEIDFIEGTVKGSKASVTISTIFQEMMSAMKSNNRTDALKLLRNATMGNLDSMFPIIFVPMIHEALSLKDLQKIFYTGAPYENHPSMQKAKEHLAKLQKEQQDMASSQAPRAIGKMFTDIAMNDTTGQQRRLSEWCGKGRYVLVDFWASWCGPCRAEMPNVSKCYEKYHEKGLDIVAISFDMNKEAWLRAIRTMNMPWVHLSDLAGWNSLGAKTYNIRGIPANILLDKEGKIIAIDLRGDELGETLAEILGE